MSKILYILDIFYKGPDYYGNCYWIARFTRANDGIRVLAKVHHSSNAYSALCKYVESITKGYACERIHWTENRLAASDFNRRSKDLPWIESPKELRKLFRKAKRGENS